MNNLHEAWLSVKKNQGSGGVDGVSIEMYEKNLHINLRELQRLLQQGRYVPDPVRRRYIEKEKWEIKTARHSHGPGSNLSASRPSNH
ncbi:hypothetical protein ACFTAO_47795 [Paenibacillus rhizoplanae]